ncbi:hypothetical protein [Herbaspirillum sp. C9C3]|uniref:hypothetical protein n=1 Tax=Herbaspirillum sp. C9C3 TaxID=2735271 RepID=UPI00158588DF|nr:hypothetical protein [Herbaspirillum sp. C9C3]NUT63462.1 hypothetical protein [Herbaspirillum sp. C9C3]
MDSEIDFHNAFRTGQRNQEVKELIQNWCRHARVEKPFGGTGIIELQTGFPIGHLTMVCDHAKQLGNARWFLEEAALIFYDQNCAGCQKRSPLRLPNLSKLVAQRDEAAKKEKEKQVEEERLEQEKFDRRIAVRADLRSRSSVVVGSFLDDIDLFDQNRDPQAEEKLITSVRLAPELLTNDIRDYFYSLLEAGEYWCEKLALTILGMRSDVDDRLVKHAASSLQSGRCKSLAAQILLDRIDQIGKIDIGSCARALSLLAMPPRTPLDFEENREEGDAEPLCRIYEAYKEAITKGIDNLICTDSASSIGSGARAVTALTPKFPEIASRLRRSLAVKLVRAEHISDLVNDHVFRDVVDALSKALLSGFFADPTLADIDLMRHFEGASLAGEERIIAIYERILRKGSNRYPEPEMISDYEPYRIALTRLINVAASSTNDKVITKIVEALQRSPEGLIPLAHEKMDMLLGAAALSDTKVEAAEENAKIITHKDFYDELDEQHRRRRLRDLRSGFSRWAICGAGMNEVGLTQLSRFLEKSENFSDGYMASLIEELSVLAQRGESLQVILPFIYRAMVGKSVLVRAAAARALGEMGSRRSAELPSLVFEAFHLMLRDPYLLVHKTAVETLDRVRIPDEMKQGFYRDLLNLVVCYREDKDQRFLLKCIKLYTSEHHTNENFGSETGATFIALLEKINHAPLLSNDADWLLRDLSTSPGYTALILGLVKETVEDYQVEHLLRAISNIPMGATSQHLPAIKRAASAAAGEGRTIAAMLEVLTRDGEWSVARDVAILHEKAVPDGQRMQIHRFIAKKIRCQIEFEYFLSRGEAFEANQVGKEWAKTEEELQQFYAERNKHAPF